MANKSLHTILTIFIASVWLINGLLCKVLNLAPRHEQIVANILSEAHARPLTLVIGVSEIIMAVWIFTKYQSKLNAIAQMTIIAAMNILEFILVPELLLWGRLNAVFAIAFIGLIYYNEFVLNKPLHLPSSSS